MYFISGLGADGRAFYKIKLPRGYQPIYLDWIIPLAGESFPDYAKRFSQCIKQDEEFILIGTTDENFVGDLNSPVPDVEEITYLCGVVNRYFRDAITPDELVWSFAGVRSLYDDGADKPEDVTRDYEVVLDERPEEAPLLTIYGGKITTHRKLAEAVMLRIGQFFEARPPWTAASRLPGGEFAPQDFDAEVAELLRRWPFLSVPHARRLMRAYGRRAERILKDAKTMDDLGQRFAVDLTASEVRYLVENEWAQNADDILWRRSKLGLKIASKERLALDRFIASGMDTSPSKN